MNRCRRTGGWSRATPFFRFVQARKGARVDFRGHRRRRYTALVLVLTFVSGCLSPPRRASETMVNPPMARVSSEVPAHVDEAGLLSADLWKQSGDLNPQAVLVPGRRVVVTEFDVEFVSYQFQACKRQQLIIDPKVHPLELIGMGRRYTPMTEEDQQALASELYGAFLQDLRRRGLELVSQDDLHASPGYAELPKESVVRSSPLMFLNMLGSDTGTVLQTRTVAAPGLSILQGSLGGSMRAPGFLECRAPGLGVLQGGPQARTAAEARILQETRADVALAVRLRVGTFREQPALEHRSVVRLTTPEGSTTLRACHSLVSDLAVIDTPRFRPIVGRIEPVESGPFSGELTAMLPRFIGPALAASKP